MSTKSMTSLAKMQLKDNAKWTITSNSLKGVGSYDYTYTYPYQELYVMVPDEESVDEGKDLISKVTSNEILESSYDGDSSNVHSVTKSNVYKPSSNTKKKTTTSKKKTEVKKEEIAQVPDKAEDIQNDETVEPDVDENTEADSDNTTIPEENENTGDDNNAVTPPENSEIPAP